MLTIAIPVGPGHEEISERAQESVRRQTVQTVVGVAYHDQDGRGAGVARNNLLQQVTTPFVCFLDADDWLEPNFAAEMLAAATLAQPQGRYVYSGWFESTRNAEIPVDIPTECYCFHNGWKVHLVSAVVPTEWLRSIGGFDESLPGMEDTDLFHRLHEAGHCGEPVFKHLVHYTENGMRSKALRARADYIQIKEQMGKRYHKQTMSCCGAQAVQNNGPFGDAQPGDVLAQVIGPAFAKYVGRQSRRLYPPGVGYGQLVWADPRDVASDPSRFKLAPVEQIPPLPPVTTAAQIAEAMMGQASAVYIPPTPKPEKVTPSKLKKMAGLGNE